MNKQVIIYDDVTVGILEDFDETYDILVVNERTGRRILKRLENSKIFSPFSSEESALATIESFTERNGDYENLFGALEVCPAGGRGHSLVYKKDGKIDFLGVSQRYDSVRLADQGPYSGGNYFLLINRDMCEYRYEPYTLSDRQMKDVADYGSNFVFIRSITGGYLSMVFLDDTKSS